LSGAAPAEKNDAAPMDIRELAADREIAAAFPLMRQLRDGLREETFLPEVRRQQVARLSTFPLTG
jgi:hypothetical protein